LPHCRSGNAATSTLQRVVIKIHLPLTSGASRCAPVHFASIQQKTLDRRAAAGAGSALSVGCCSVSGAERSALQTSRSPGTTAARRRWPGCSPARPPSQRPAPPARSGVQAQGGTRQPQRTPTLAGQARRPVAGADGFHAPSLPPRRTVSASAVESPQARPGSGQPHSGVSRPRSHRAAQAGARRRRHL
jgi:hypothetical protein